MSKIELPNIANPSNVSLMNDNFKKIEGALNEEVLYRKGYTGEPNEMQSNLDMNSNRILNLLDAVDLSEPVTLRQLIEVDSGEALQLRMDLAEPSGAGLVGGMPVPAADPIFAGGMLPSQSDNKDQASSVFQSGENVRIESGSYLVSGTVTSVGADKIAVFGVDGDTTIKMSGSGTLLSFQNAGSLSIRDLELDMSQPPTVATTHGIAIADQDNLELSGLSIKGLDGIGSGILSYSSSGTSVKDALLSDIKIEGDRANSTNTNGFVLVDTNYSHARNVKVSGVASFALELKNNSEHNIISNSSADNCNAGLYYGSDIVGKNPRYNVATGIIAKDCLSGYTPGGGTDNLVSGILFDMRGIVPNSSTSAARVGSFNSSVYGAHAVGSGNIIRYDTEARDNFTQISVHPTSASFAYVAYEAGSERNVAEITHPGAGNNTIRPKISRPVGMPVSGSQSNPVYCHASGEYLGTLGIGWLWQHADITNTRASTHKWRFEGAGDSYLSVASDGLGSVGYSVNTPSGNRDLTWLETGPYWQLAGNGYNVRFYSSTIRPGADNTMDFGTSAFRGRTAYFATGTINTSDANEKTAPVSIAELSGQFGLDNDLILDSWGDVQIIAFQWLDAIRQKGDDVARWHFGVIAQQVRDAFSARGLDGTRYGLLCYDEWDDEFEPVTEEVIEETEVEQEDGSIKVIRFANVIDTGEKRLLRKAGNRWGIRPDQCLFLEAAYQRRRCDRIEERLLSLENK